VIVQHQGFLKEWNGRHLNEGTHHQGTDQEGIEGTQRIDESTAIDTILTFLLLDFKHCCDYFCLLISFYQHLILFFLPLSDASC
jgi:hypothetical protein